MKTLVALYPYSPQVLPLVRHFDQLQDEYTLEKIYSLPGSALKGKDASYACNHPPIGRTVEGEIDIKDSSWTFLIIPAYVDRKRDDGNHIFNQIKRVLRAGKSVVVCGDSGMRFSKSVEALKRQYSNQFLILSERALSPQSVVTNEQYSRIDVPVILVGGLVESSDTLEVLMGISSELRRRHICASTIIKQPMGKLFGFHSYDSIFASGGRTPAEKIEALNRFVRVIERAERPNVILIEAPDAVMRFNKLAPSGFGILTYMLTQALQIDYLICSVPLELVAPPLLDALSEDFSIRLGSPIHAVHVSNIIVDSADMLQTHVLSYVYSNLDCVQIKIEQEMSNSKIPLFDVVRNGSQSLVQCLGFQ